MATTPIVTELTFAQLEALVATNGLNEGLQYKVTDKDWLLIAISNNTLTTFAQAPLIIFNNDEYPLFIEINTIIVDCGLIDTDISTSTGETYTVGFSQVGTTCFVPTRVHIVIPQLTNTTRNLNINYGGDAGYTIENIPAFCLLQIISNTEFIGTGDSVRINADDNSGIQIKVIYEKII